MLAKLKSYGLNGINGFNVDIEADINTGMVKFDTVGLPDAAIKESKERIRSAIKNSHLFFPTKKITVNLAPADQKKVGACYDLPIAICILAASEQIPCSLIKDYIFFGELGLDGCVRKINGLLPMLIAAAKDGYKKIIIPKENEREAAFIKEAEIYAVETLNDAVAFLMKERDISPIKCLDIIECLNQNQSANDFSYIKGQYRAKRAIEIAAAGGHNILLIGPPGAGKTMLARALPGILPNLTADEALETTKIHSVAGVLDSQSGLVSSRPFRSPHHTATTISLTGGGNNAKPGEMSLAHNGVLYLDEMPEYNRHSLEVLRQPLEDGVITITRNTRAVCYPAEFMLVASMNPCPCGYYGSKTMQCKCTPSIISKYTAKLSGPLLDRIDLHVEADNVEYSELADSSLAESSTTIKARVDMARDIQTKRFFGTKTRCNAKMSTAQLREFCLLTEETDKLLAAAFNALKLSARAHSRILKVARTIADLESCQTIEARHLAEAVQYRSLDKKYNI